MINFRGDLSDISAKTATLVLGRKSNVLEAFGSIIRHCTATQSDKAKCMWNIYTILSRRMDRDLNSRNVAHSFVRSVSYH